MGIWFLLNLYNQDIDILQIKDELEGLKIIRTLNRNLHGDSTRQPSTIRSLSQI